MSVLVLLVEIEALVLLREVEIPEGLASRG
jgi:hypothetical protein